MKTLLISLIYLEICYGNIPLVINTWNFQHAAQKAWKVLNEFNGGGSALDALTEGCKVCQDEQCDGTVGYGGSPDENGETTLDALIFDGNTMDMGAVGGIRKIKNAIAVARHVLEETEHSLLVGSLATEFATNFNFTEESLQTNHSLSLWETWKNNDSCQPNFWKNVNPDPKKYCGPYSLSKDVKGTVNRKTNVYDRNNHDTIGMIVISSDGHIVAGTSTNGAKFKIPGRVGDSPVPGAGAYADSEVGAATATGDGDVMMRFLPSFLAVEQMRQGLSPSEAALIAVARIAKKHPNFFGAVIAVNRKGTVGAACNGMDEFPFSLASGNDANATVEFVSCLRNYSESYFVHVFFLVGAAVFIVSRFFL